jgi:hypothetical protein
VLRLNAWERGSGVPESLHILISASPCPLTPSSSVVKNCLWYLFLNFGNNRLMKILGTKNSLCIANSHMWGLIILLGSCVSILSVMVGSNDLGSGGIQYLACCLAWR